MIYNTTTNLRDIKQKQTTFKSIFKDAFTYGFSSQDAYTPYYKQIHRLNKYTAIERTTTISQCYLSIDMNKFLYKSQSKMKQYIENQNVEFLENEQVYSQPVYDYISECMDKNHTITITVSLENYIYDKEENTHVTHSTLIVLHPVSTKPSKKTASTQYNMFYINSHGGSLFYTNFHEKLICRQTRIKKTTFKLPIDFILTQCFVKTINKNNKDYGLNTRINYNLSDNHNYLKLNLQSYDNYGCCFIFPILFNLIIHTNYNKYFINKNKRYSIIVEQTVDQMLENKNIDLLVYHSLAQIDDRINHYLAKYYSDIKKQTYLRKKQIKTRSNKRDMMDIEDVCEELYDSIDNHLDNHKHRFIKSTLTKTMMFIKQNWKIYQQEVYV